MPKRIEAGVARQEGPPIKGGAWWDLGVLGLWSPNLNVPPRPPVLFVAMQGEARAKTVAAGVAVAMVAAMGLLGSARPKSVAKPMIATHVCSAEVSRIAAEAPSDPLAARKKMMVVYRGNGLRSGEDYAMAARVIAGSDDKTDLALAHDLAIAGLSLGNVAARTLVAETEDRLFAKVGLGERYGTLGGKELPLTGTHRDLLLMAPNTMVRATAE